MRVRDVEDAVERDIFYQVDTETFIEKMIPHNPTTAQSLQKLVDDKRYKNSRWTKFPRRLNGPHNEKSLYKTFADVLNAIVETIPHKVPSKIVYLGPHSDTPEFLDTGMATERPYGVGATHALAMEELEAKICKLEEEIAVIWANAADENQALLEQQEKERDLVSSYRLWWMGIHLPYEVNPESLEWYESAEQLVIYMRLMLIEQLDRRFVLGFILNFNELRLVLCDRSGVIVTKTPINIHKDPEKFIRIITGFSSMKPEELGWDPTMKIYRPASDDVCPSYEVGPEFQGVFGNNLCDFHWVFDVVENNEVVKYVAVSVISALKPGEICGRATCVYEVVKFDERYDPTETRALKRYWRPIAPENPDLYPSEGEVYRILDKGKPDTAKHMYAFHDVKVNGQIDSTLKSIRHGLEVKPSDHPVELLSTQYETNTAAQHGLLQHNVPETIPDPFFKLLTLTPLVDRHHTNILMPMGENITMGSSLRELLLCLRGSILDHHSAHQQGILHRVISAGDILIFENPNGESFGHLIGYDQAKRTKSFSAIVSKTKDFSDEELKQAQTEVRQNIIRVDGQVMMVENLDDLVQEALRWISDPYLAANYVIECVKSIQPASDSQPSDDEPAGWWPDFGPSGCMYLEGEQTRPSPYMSGEVMAQVSLVAPQFEDNGQPPFVHEAIHDLEGFLWVIVHICVYRKGPGINTEDAELDPQKPDFFNAAMSKSRMHSFEGMELSPKLRLLRKPQLFEDKIITQFHPYFEPLKPLVRKWWCTIILGYRYRGKEFYNIHQYVIRILDEAIAALPDQTGDESTQKELTRRKERREHVLGTFKRFKPKCQEPALGHVPLWK